MYIEHVVYIKFKVHFVYIVKPIYKGHSMEPENVAFISSCPLNTCLNYMHYSLKGKMNEFEFLVFYATFSNISAISWQPVLVVEEAGVHGEKHRP